MKRYVDKTQWESLADLIRTAARVILLGLVTMSGTLDPRTIDAQGAQLLLPFSKGETWYVCQGYSTPSGTHNGPDKYALDLTIDPQGVCPNGCCGDENASAGHHVLAPGAGSVAAVAGDGLCLNLDAGQSMWIAHMTGIVANGTRVSRGQRLGTVAVPDSANGNYSHIHVRIQPEHGCGGPTQGGNPIPFDDAHGTRFEGAPDLPDVGGTNQHSGTRLSRYCPLFRKGDGNCDGCVNDLDYVVWWKSYEKDQGGDFNGDGVTDDLDYVVWWKYYGEGC